MLQLLQRRWRRHSVFRRRAPTPSALASAPLAATSPWYCWWLWLPASGSGGCTPGPGSSSGGGRVRPAARGGSGSARSFRRLSPSRSAVASILRQLRHRLAACGSGSSCGGCTSCSGSCNGGGGGTRCFVGGHRLPRLWPLLLRQLPPLVVLLVAPAPVCVLNTCPAACVDPGVLASSPSAPSAETTSCRLRAPAPAAALRWLRRQQCHRHAGSRFQRAPFGIFDMLSLPLHP